jgi:TPR repeat protein
MLIKGAGGKEDWKAALPPMEKACDASDHDACLSVGAIFAEGKGAKIDRPRALSIFDGLCQEQKMKTACDNIDAMLGNNWGIPGSGAGRVEALERLCEHRSGVACEKLGDDYARGRGGVKRDLARAQELYTAGCDIGERSACKKMK